MEVVISSSLIAIIATCERENACVCYVLAPGEEEEEGGGKGEGGGGGGRERRK